MSLSNASPVTFVSVTSREGGRSFYEGVLGLAHKSSDDYGDFYSLANGALLRLTPMPGLTPSPHPVLGWEVPDIREAAAGLRAKGIAFAVYEGMGQDELGIWTAPDGRARNRLLQRPVRQCVEPGGALSRYGRLMLRRRASRAYRRGQSSPKKGPSLGPSR